MKYRRAPALVLVVAASGAEAHGFGQRYDLPLPLELYVCGAALTVLATCILFAFFVRAPGPQGYPRWDLLATAPGRLLASPVFVGAVRLVAIALLALVIFAGFFGNQNPFKNVAPVAVWALGWVGLAYVSALVGDVWKVANPFDTAFAALERRSSRWRGKPLTPLRAPPTWLRAWPAVAIYLVFLWFEIAWGGSESPRGIAAVIVVYAVVTWAGMAAFGRERWLESGEVFSLVFGVFARFAPMHIELAARRVSAWHLRPYAVGLFAREPLDASRIALVIVILAAVTFDGFLETPAWAAIAQGVAPEDASWPRSAGLILAPLLFAAIYLAFCRLIARGGAALNGSDARIAGLFVLTLVPIAIGYQVAHYFSFLVQATQYLVPLASDPFGWGWNLFMTAHWFVRVNVVDARVVWIASIAAIVAGHVAALYLAHSLSMREFHDRRAAMRSQGPMLVLMVAYTMSSLWIIAQPIVTTR